MSEYQFGSTVTALEAMAGILCRLADSLDIIVQAIVNMEEDDE